MEYGGISYEKYDCPDRGAETMVLLHGLTGNISRWREYIEPLRAKYNLIIPELIGHGNSYYPDKLEEYSFPAQAERILAVLEKEGCKGIVLVCHSYSAGIGLEILNSEEIGTSKIIFISPYFNDGSDKFKRYSWLINIFVSCWRYLAHKRRPGRFIYPLDQDKAGRLNYRKGINEIGMKSYLAHLNACQKNTASIDTHNIPALLIRKKEEKISSPEMIDILKNKFPGLEEKILAGSGHMYLLKDRKEILDALCGIA